MLTVKHPTPTTVRYTVSTRSPTRTFAAELTRLCLGALRFTIGLFLLLVLFAKARVTLVESNRSQTWYLDELFAKGALGHVATQVAEHLAWRWLIPSSAVILWAIFRRGYTEESLLVIRGLGVQTSTSSPTYLSTSSTRFIPTNVIQDIFIHEAFKGFEVKFYLAIVVEGEEDVVVVFPVSSVGSDSIACADRPQNILPKREALEEVWRGTKACLYEPKAT